MIQNSNKNTPAQTKPDIQPVQESLSRILWLKIGLIVFFAVVALRLGQIQILESPKYKRIAKKQYEVIVPLLASRGNIYDRNGRILASSSLAISYAADPKIVGNDASRIAERFASVFGSARKDEYLAKLQKAGSRFVWLERRAKPQTSSLVDARDFEGVIQINEPRRIYHYDHVAGQVLGFTDVDNKGLSGIELEFDSQLKGQNGSVIMQRDGLGRKHATVDYPTIEPVNGNSIVLTIDLEYQSIAEEELRNGVIQNKAESGLVVMLDAHTSEVFAMASYPSIDPATYAGADPASAKNRVITDMFEPGSVFKLVTVSAALENNIITPQQEFFAENGKYFVKGRPSPISDMHKYGILTFREAVELSSNIVMAKASDLIGAEKLYTTARNFGFGTQTGLELPGEVTGQLKKPNQWSRTSLNSMAYGYEVGATPLQIAAAYAAVANGGKLMKPYILKQILNERNEVISESNAQTIRRVISKTTADTLRSFLRGVVERGTGTSAKSNAVMIAGKTGTSKKMRDGKYSASEYTASFVGMFPAEDPTVVCLVMLDNPKTFGYSGGIASAPIVKGIAEKIIATAHAIPQQKNLMVTGKEFLVAPDVRTLEVGAASATLSALGLKAEITGDGPIVLQQSPAPGIQLLKGESVRIMTAGTTAALAGGYTLVPELKGLSLRRALNLLTIAHLDVQVDGVGAVVAQSINGGQQVKTGTRIAIRCASKRHAMISLL